MHCIVFSVFSLTEALGVLIWYMCVYSMHSSLVKAFRGELQLKRSKLEGELKKEFKSKLRRELQSKLKRTL